MNIESDEVPQANRLASVLKSILNIGNGARTDEEIIDGIEGLGTDRQGRYYRKVGELLGFVINEKNNAHLTNLGQQFFNSPTSKETLLQDAVLRMKVFQKLLPFIELHDEVNRNQCAEYLKSLQIELADSTMKRRVSSLLAWLVQLNILEKKNSNYRIKNMTSPKTGLFEVEDIEQPILPETGDLSEYETVEMRTSAAEQTIITYKRSAAAERADNSHRKLVNITSERIKNAGSIPKYNQFIDLATRYQNQDFIFEMKSTTENNEKNQVRAGLSQLYEYRYLQNKPEAKLILVIENSLSKKESWRSDYLENDRDIYLLWNGNEQLYGHEKTKRDLSFLNISN